MWVPCICSCKIEMHVYDSHTTLSLRTPPESRGVWIVEVKLLYEKRPWLTLRPVWLPENRETVLTMGSSFIHKKVPYVIMCDNFIEWQGMSTFTNKKSPSSVNICRRKLEFNFKMGDPFSSFVTIIPNSPLHLNLPVKYRPIYRSQWPR